MAVLEKILRMHAEMAEWRHDVRAHPETAFEGLRTSALMAQRIESFGLRMRRGLAAESNDPIFSTADQQEFQSCFI